jgi:hypothetical protein
MMARHTTDSAQPRPGVVEYVAKRPQRVQNNSEGEMLRKLLKREEKKMGGLKIATLLVTNRAKVQYAGPHTHQCKPKAGCRQGRWLEGLIQ